jgi:Sulfotransferase domain
VTRNCKEAWSHAGIKSWVKPRAAAHVIRTIPTGTISMDRDLIALVAFPKSGITYLSSLLFYSLFPAGSDPNRIEESFIVDVHQNPVEGAQEVDGNKYVKMHFAFDTNKSFIDRTTKALYMIRDPIDIMNSAYDFYRLLDADSIVDYQTFVNDWIETGGGGFDFAGTWKTNVTSWMNQRQIPLLLIHYTDLVDRPAEQLDRILAFLDVAPACDRVAEAITHSSMTAMRAREEDEYRRKAAGIYYKPFLEKSMDSGARFINKGYRDSWEKLSPSQKTAAERQFGDLYQLLRA